MRIRSRLLGYDVYERAKKRWRHVNYVEQLPPPIERLPGTKFKPRFTRQRVGSGR